MATGVRTPDHNAIGNFQRQMRLLGDKVERLERALAAAEARIDALEERPVLKAKVAA